MVSPKSIVYFGESLIEIDEPNVTLGDLCEAFQIPCEAGVYVRERTTGRVIATLSFDCIPLPAVAAKRGGGGGSSSSTGDGANTTANSELQFDHDEDDEDEEGNAAQGTTTLLLDLCVSSGSFSGAQDGGSSGIDSREGATDFTHSDATPDNDGHAQQQHLTAAMRSIVQLGAVELLAEESAQRVERAEPYDPTTAPGLLRRIVYASSVYSPFLNQRDPLGPAIMSGAGGRLNMAALGVNNTWGADALYDGAPYLSAIETYDVQDPSMSSRKEWISRSLQLS